MTDPARDAMAACGYGHDHSVPQKDFPNSCLLERIRVLEADFAEAKRLLRETQAWLPNNAWRGNPYRTIRQFLSSDSAGRESGKVSGDSKATASGAHVAAANPGGVFRGTDGTTDASRKRRASAEHQECGT